MTDAIQIVTTTASRQEAERIARELVERQVAACVQISGPIESVYRWQGKIESSQEWQCTIKTRRSHYRAVEAMIRTLHSYEVPEILAVSIIAGNRDYLEWLDQQIIEPGRPDVV